MVVFALVATTPTWDFIFHVFRKMTDTELNRFQELDDHRKSSLHQRLHDFYARGHHVDDAVALILKELGPSTDAATP